MGNGNSKNGAAWECLVVDANTLVRWTMAVLGGEVEHLDRNFATDRWVSVVPMFVFVSCDGARFRAI